MSSVTSTIDSTPVKTEKSSPLPVNQRGEGWIKYADHVVVIVVAGEKIRIIEGTISSRPTRGDKIADNITRTAVWGRQKFDPMGEGADGMYEQDFNVSDPHLLKEAEAPTLRDEEVALAWFAGIHSPETIKKIVEALREKFPA